MKLKIENALIIGVLVIALLAVPVIAAATEATEVTDHEGRWGTPAVETAQGYTPQTPYTSYFYFFNHGVMATTETPNPYVTHQENDGQGHWTYLTVAPSPTLNATAWVDLPVTGVASVSGTHPKVRYAYIQMGSYFHRGAIDRIEIYNGWTTVKTQVVDFTGDAGFAEYTLDLGAYYDMVRGMNMRCRIYNKDTTQTGLNSIDGYGAKAEW
jgi:hypothetical protein